MYIAQSLNAPAEEAKTHAKKLEVLLQEFKEQQVEIPDAVERAANGHIDAHRVAEAPHALDGEIPKENEEEDDSSSED